MVRSVLGVLRWETHGTCEGTKLYVVDGLKKGLSRKDKISCTLGNAIIWFLWK